MKSFIYIFTLLMSTAVMVSCTADELPDNKEASAEKEYPQTVKLNFTAPAAMDVTISRNAEIAKDFLISDLYVYIFDKDGTLLTVNDNNSPAPTYLEGEALLDGTNGAQLIKENINGGKYNSSWVRCKVNSNAFDKEEVYLYLVANVKSYLNETDLTHSELMAITNKESLEECIYNYSKQIDINKTSFLMSGYGVAGIDMSPLSYQITRNGEIQLFGLPANIVLERAESKINFNIKSNSTKGEFTLNSYQIHNYPQKSYLFWKYPLEGSYYNHYNYIAGKDASPEGDHFLVTEPIEVKGTNNFTFYMPENLKGNGKNNINDKKNAKEALNTREKRDLSGNWINAPNLATYVEINGTFTGTSTKLNKPVNAEVKYIIHLGMTRENGNGNLYYVHDYFICRNREYTYNLTVNGIDDIAIEVINDEEKISAVEGSITVEEMLPVTDDARLTVYDKEVWEMENNEKNSWLCIDGKPVEEWIYVTPVKGEYAITAETLEEVADRQVVLLATRTSTDGRSKIIRRITVKQTIS